jgi:hypothetical protein
MERAGRRVLILSKEVNESNKKRLGAKRQLGPET